MPDPHWHDHPQERTHQDKTYLVKIRAIRKPSGNWVWVVGQNWTHYRKFRDPEDNTYY